MKACTGPVSARVEQNLVAEIEEEEMPALAGTRRKLERSSSRSILRPPEKPIILS